jgi:crotonobetainyl-CoA:carnitine CoA-transferase CaiB-like acyl-CoA transferase
MYDLLKGIRALEVAALAPDRMGGQLAELGAEVIKVEMPPHGSHTRLMGKFRGGPALTHYTWNRGKKSLGLDLHTPAGRELFLELVRQSDVVLDGLRAGAMERFGLGYDVVSQANPKIVFCSLNGTGQNGPYRDLGTHGVAFDAMSGIASVAFREDGRPYIAPHVSIGVTAGALVGALAVSAALVKAQLTGKGTRIDVSEMDSAAHWKASELATVLNDPKGETVRPGGYMNRVRYQFYETKDGKYILFQPYEWKFWEKFCRIMDRQDLLDKSTPPPNGNPNFLDDATGDETLRAEIAEIMKTKTQAEWVQVFLTENIPGAPGYTVRELIDDPHFRARENVYVMEGTDVGTVELPSSPIKLPGQQFEVAPPPRAGQHTREVLSELLKLDDSRLQQLAEQKVIGFDAGA